MKATFVLASCLSRLLSENKLDVARINQAVQAVLSQAVLEKEATKLGNVRSYEKTGVYNVSETVVSKYVGKVCAVSEFADFSDKLRATEKRFGDQIDLAAIPARWRDWLLKFQATANGKGKGKAPETPTPTAP